MSLQWSTAVGSVPANFELTTHCISLHQTFKTPFDVEQIYLGASVSDVLSLPRAENASKLSSPGKCVAEVTLCRLLLLNRAMVGSADSSDKTTTNFVSTSEESSRKACTHR